MTDQERIEWLSRFDIWVSDDYGNVLLYDLDGGPFTPERFRAEIDSAITDRPMPLAPKAPSA